VRDGDEPAALSQQPRCLLAKSPTDDQISTDPGGAEDTASERPHDVLPYGPERRQRDKNYDRDNVHA
jgi:hypothetical protein